MSNEADVNIQIAQDVPWVFGNDKVKHTVMTIRVLFELQNTPSLIKYLV